MTSTWYLIAGVLLLIAGYVKFVFTYWERKKFPSLPPQIPFGNLKTVIQQKLSFGEFTRSVYEHYKAPYLGLYMLFRPVLLVSDAELVKRVLVSDFDHFVDRGVHFDEENDPVGANLFGMQGQEWKDMRAKLSPTFTSGKLKNMFQPIEEKTQLLQKHLDELIDTETEEVPLKKAMIRMNLSIIASVFFGFELNAFDNPQHEFNQMGDLFFDTSITRNKFAQFAFFLCPSVLSWFKVPVQSPVVSKYILNLVNSVMEARKEDPSLIRKDFIQTVMEMMQHANKDDKVKFTVEKCAAQAFLFYTAGYETSAATSSYCMYELSKSPEWLERARAEVDAVMKRNGGRILYEDLGELKVLDMCIKEAMRKYPAVPILNRECTKEYKIPGSEQHVIPKGMPVIVPIYGLQMDPKHFPEPERFDPSRFEAENVKVDMPFYPVSGGGGMVWNWRELMSLLLLSARGRSTLLRGCPSRNNDDQNGTVHAAVQLRV